MWASHTHRARDDFQDELRRAIGTAIYDIWLEGVDHLEETLIDNMYHGTLNKLLEKKEELLTTEMTFEVRMEYRRPATHWGGSRGEPTTVSQERFVKGTLIARMDHSQLSLPRSLPTVLSLSTGCPTQEASGYLSPPVADSRRRGTSLDILFRPAHPRSTRRRHKRFGTGTSGAAQPSRLKSEDGKDGC